MKATIHSAFFIDLIDERYEEELATIALNCWKAMYTMYEVSISNASLLTEHVNMENASQTNVC